MSDNVVRDRLARVLWRFACPPKLRDELAPPPVFVEMADAVVAELAAIRAENTEASAAMADYLRNIEVMDRAGFLARYGQVGVRAAVESGPVGSWLARGCCGGGPGPLPFRGGLHRRVSGCRSCLTMPRWL